MLDQVLNHFGACRRQRERDGYQVEGYTVEKVRKKLNIIWIL